MTFPPPAPKFILQGWRLSYYTAKLHSYMSYKQIPFKFIPMNLIDLRVIVPQRVGVSVMPVLQCLQTNATLQDTHDIILNLEKAYPHRPVIPTPSVHPSQSFLAYLLEAWFDEFWIIPAMYYRWNFPESVSFFKEEACRYLLGPTFSRILPASIMSPLTGAIEHQLTSYLPAVGVRPQQHAMIEDWTTETLSSLDAHFAKFDYLLGTNTPTLADFALAGPLDAHLCRDPYPLHNLMHRFPNVMEFAARMAAKSWTADSEENVLAVDESRSPSRHSDFVPDTLVPIVQQIFSEFVPMIERVESQVVAIADHPKFSIYGEGRPLPRALNEIEMPLLHGKHVFHRAALPFNMWKFQQVRNHFQSMSQDHQQDILHWLHSKGVLNTSALLTKGFPQLTRTALKVKF